MGIGRIWRRLAAAFQGAGEDTSTGDPPTGRERQAPPRSTRIDRHYVSEFTTFMNHYLEEHPEVVADQARGRAIYWDRKLNLEEIRKEAEDSAPAESYVYFPLFRRQPPANK